MTTKYLPEFEAEDIEKYHSYQRQIAEAEQREEVTSSSESGLDAEEEYTENSIGHRKIVTTTRQSYEVYEDGKLIKKEVGTDEKIGTIEELPDAQFLMDKFRDENGNLMNMTKTETNGNTVTTTTITTNVTRNNFFNKPAGEVRQSSSSLVTNNFFGNKL
jgi:hypothetical protein